MESEAEDLLFRAEKHPAEAVVALQRAIDLRETIYRIFAEIAHQRPPAAADLAELNDFLAEGAPHFQVVAGKEGFAWDWRSADGRLDPMLWPIVRSAAHLLTSAELDRVGQCADDRGCGWLFLDTSRNRSRRWCSMEDCGNRAKARSHYKRQRGEG